MNAWPKALNFACALLIAATMPGQAFAQSAPAAPPQQAAPAADEDAFTRAELEKLLAPIALHTDALLAQLLPASAYPLEIVQASRWLDRNKAAVDKGDFSGADAQNWDPSVKALIRFPSLIRKMNEDLDWTSDLGDAFVTQPEDVATVIQDLRRKAQSTGALKTTKQQKVVTRQESGRDVVIIEPAEPDVIYVADYDPVAVYDTGVGSAVAAGLIGFGTGVAVGAIASNAWNWGSGTVYPPVWPGYPGYRPRPPLVPGVPGRPGLVPGRPGGDINIGGGNVNVGGGNVNIGNGNIGNGNNIIGNTKPWRPDPDRHRPGQGTKPGLGANRPGGGVNRPGGDGGGINRPTTLPATLPATINRPTTLPATVNRPAAARPASAPAIQRPPQAAQRPAPRPAAPPRPQRPDTAFGGLDLGPGAAMVGQRGAASRGGRPMPGIGGGGGGGPRAAIGAGGGGGGVGRAAIQRPAGGGGGMRGGGGGRRR